MSNESSKGFTLIEVMIALLILAAALTVLNTSSSSSIASVQKAGSLETIAQLLQQKATEYELTYKGKKFEELKESESGDFGSDYPEFRWAVQVDDFPAPNLASMAQQDEGQQEMLLTILNKFSKHLEKAVKEVKVSVFWKPGEKEQEYSVTFLLVDYETPIGM
ncbi:MAG: prepilin-type N-terminal cleavage/methylation domain-containing protein [Bdellovibrionales bacterium]|nr:prepilin-type N-terminal cleavage/methylation domain-containing protein [Bdellovibrionales bacterium]